MISFLKASKDNALFKGKMVGLEGPKSTISIPGEVSLGSRVSVLLLLCLRNDEN